MSEVQRYQHIGPLCLSTDGLMKLYPSATQYVKATDYDALEAETQALREEVAAYEDGMRSLACQLGAGGFNAEKLTAAQLVEKVQWGIDNLAETQGRLLDEVRSERDALRARAVVVQDWQPLTAVGQVETGDLLRFTVGGKEIEAPARLVIAPGDPKEEIVYNRGKNHYFITSMAVDGTSSHKGVMVKRLNGKAVSEGLLLGLVQVIEKYTHDARVPNEVSQEVAEVLILAKRELLGEGKEHE
ncbi:hypothetical protein [Pseudomonas nitroreducens]|uniref:hypothetical protein n=1 Tax=Pseudomonas nitroreducens TaxID=46680 RepID=UPI00265A2350|nr:hypothetical protein [Pseudomonas nitroreducens]MCP1651643.1 FtsZ-binding cell division protein ZapB [Pseudomonas nitroreducens]MCP1684492.1 FtsZ-binding cell division protein ZapB [Pseudomonas nitroreducens]